MRCNVSVVYVKILDMSTSTPSATLADADRQAIMRDAFHAGISASSQSVLDILDQFPDDPEFAVACIRRTVEGRTLAGGRRRGRAVHR